MRAEKNLEIAVDVGGTFIDIIMLNKDKCESTVRKILHKPGHQGEDILESIDNLTRQYDLGLENIETLLIGTTVVTNALLERTLPRVALLTTEGFRDVLEIARMTRASSYDLDQRRPVPIVPRELRLEVRERLGADGKTLVPLDHSSIERHVDTLKAADVEAIAVSLLFSFANPHHEQQVRDVLAAHFDVPISISSEVLPTFREFERTSTCVINAAMTPVMNRFLDTLSRLAASIPEVYLMGSDAGCLTLPEAKRLPARCSMSGPAGGVLAALRLAERYDLSDIITLDVGGTSTDVALLPGSSVPLTNERTISGFAVALPSVEVETIGAGGGSIARLDLTGLLKVGPESARGDPGPVCYGKGGTAPTVTDAHVTLGRLGKKTMLGGNFEIDDRAAARAIEEFIAKPGNLTTMRAAQGILDIANANIAKAIRSISVERGHDPRSMTLVAFGGAGPLHACDVARSLGVPRVAIPLYPGVWSATGILAADISYSVQQTWMQTLTADNMTELAGLFETVTAQLLQKAGAQGMATSQFKIQRAVDIRYEGQSHTLGVPLNALSAADIGRMVEDFHEAHQRRYGHSAPKDNVEIVNINVAARLERASSKIDTPPATGKKPKSTEIRKVWFTPEGADDCPVYNRTDLQPNDELIGPAIIEQYDTTVIISAGDRLRVTPDGAALIISIAI